MSYQSSLWTRTLCASAIAFSLVDGLGCRRVRRFHRADAGPGRTATAPGQACIHSGHGLSSPRRAASSQEYVVSAPLAGVVDQLLVGQNEAVKPGQALPAWPARNWVSSSSS